MTAKREDYEDIINMEYPFKLKHERMSISNRAAQFLAFKALSGYDAEISEAARETCKQAELDENTKSLLDAKLKAVKEKIAEHPLVKIRYFISDDKKAGGQYAEISARIKKVDEYTKTVITENGLRIRIEDIYNLEGEIFDHAADAPSG